jgi:inward rectifier potassium channel
MRKNSKRIQATAGNDLGFGTKTNSGRNVNRDGSFNVERVGLPKLRLYEIYHHLISMSWTKFLFLILVMYTITNVIFASIYVIIGMEHLAGISGQTTIDQFWEAFFFSSQTLTTLGYGRISPVGNLASSVAAIESMMGLLGFAMATGLLYGRFSRPEARILYSEKAVIAPYRGTQRGLMFRIANMRSNQLIEVEVEFLMAFQEPNSTTRSYYPLVLERRKISMFPLSWTIVHPIDETSPLFGRDEEELHTGNAELIILVKAFDDTFSQTVYSRSSYQSDEIIWGAKFLPMFSLQQDGRTRLDLRLMNTMEKAELPPWPQQDEFTALPDPTVGSGHE